MLLSLNRFVKNEVFYWLETPNLSSPELHHVITRASPYHNPSQTMSSSELQCVITITSPRHHPSSIMSSPETHHVITRTPSPEPHHASPEPYCVITRSSRVMTWCVSGDDAAWLR